MEMCLVAVIVTMLWAGATAQSSCTNVIISMSPCLKYTTGNSETPSSSCCSQLASVVSSQPQCLCPVANGDTSSMGFNINQTRVLALPGACNVQTPPISKCKAASPGASPADKGGPIQNSGSAPAGTSDSPNTAVPGNNGSKTIPSTDGNASAGSSTKLPFSLIFILLFVGSYASNLSSF